MQWNMILMFVTEASLIFWVGGQFWPVFVLPFVQRENQEQILLYEDVERRFERSIAVPTLLLLFLAQAAILLLRTGNPLLSPLMSTSLIPYWFVREVIIGLALILAIYCLVSEHRPPLAQFFIVWINILLALSLLIAAVLSQDAEGGDDRILLVPTLGDWFHLLSASLWIGGIVYIALVYLPILKHMRPAEQLRSVLSLFPSASLLFLIGIIFALLSGLFNAMQQSLFGEHLFSTLYGRLLVVKGLLVGCLLLCSITVGLWFYPRLRRSYRASIATASGQPALPGEEIESQISTHVSRLLALLQWQLLPGGAVILCSVLLSFSSETLHAPSSGQAPGPIPPPRPFVSIVLTTDRLFTVTLTIAPNRSGENTFTVRIRDSRGIAVTRATVILSSRMQDMDMGIDTITLQPDGTGQFSGTGALGMPGNWLVRVQIRLPDKTQHQVIMRFVTPV